MYEYLPLVEKSVHYFQPTLWAHCWSAVLADNQSFLPLSVCFHGLTTQLLLFEFFISWLMADVFSLISHSVRKWQNYKNDSFTYAAVLIKCAFKCLDLSCSIGQIVNMIPRMEEALTVFFWALDLSQLSFPENSSRPIGSTIKRINWQSTKERKRMALAYK